MPAWTYQDDQELIGRYTQVQPWAVIAAALGRNEKACQAHLWRLRRGMLGWQWAMIEDRRMDALVARQEQRR